MVRFVMCHSEDRGREAGASVALKCVLWLSIPGKADFITQGSESQNSKGRTPGLLYEPLLLTLTAQTGLTIRWDNFQGKKRRWFCAAVSVLFGFCLLLSSFSIEFSVSKSEQ